MSAGPVADYPWPDTYKDRNKSLVRAACLKHVPRDALVADVTWGKGNFWGSFAWEGLWFRLIRSDIAPHPELGSHLQPEFVADFAALPYRDASVDVVVFDPPYLPYSGSLLMENLYRIQGTGSWRDIMALYERGMAEAVRVVRPGGQVWVKGMSLVNGGRFRDSEARIGEIAGGLGLAAADRFLLRRAGSRLAKRPESFLLIFETRA